MTLEKFFLLFVGGEREKREREGERFWWGGRWRRRKRSWF